MERSNIPLSGELLEVVNANGRPTGEVFDKNIIHAEGLLHRVAHVWLTDGTSFLQQQRGIDTRIMPGKYDATASGHVDLGETYVDAARRELDEEMGLAIPVRRFRPRGIFRRDEPMEGSRVPHRVIGENFVVYEPHLTLEGLRLADREVQGARLYGIDQLETDLRKSSTAAQHAPHPAVMYGAVIAGMRQAGR